MYGVSRTAARPGAVDQFLEADLTSRTRPNLPAVQALVHCAALSTPWAAPEAYRETNVTATANLIAEAQQLRVPHFVFISSSSVQYAHGDQLGLTEATPLPERSINAYAQSKREAEGLVQRCGLPHLTLRPRAVFGPGDTVLFPRILRAARKGVLPRIQRPDGKSPLADLIYIENLAHYVGEAVAKQTTGLYNLTNNEPVELYPFLDSVFGQLGIPPVRRSVPVGLAMAVARGMELGSALLAGYREPPLTRFGVEVMAYSKTFSVERMLARWGAPPVSIAEGTRRFVQWVKEGGGA